MTSAPIIAQKHVTPTTTRRVTSFWKNGASRFDMLCLIIHDSSGWWSPWAAISSLPNLELPESGWSISAVMAHLADHNIIRETIIHVNWSCVFNVSRHDPLFAYSAIINFYLRRRAHATLIKAHFNKRARARDSPLCAMPVVSWSIVSMVEALPCFQRKQM